MLVKIIEARVSEIFHLAEKELKTIPLKGLLPAGIVLTGGGAKLPRIVELAKKELKLPVRIGFPQNLVGSEKDPSFSTCFGLVLMAQERGTSSGEVGGHLGPKEGLGKIFKKVFKTFIP